VKTAPSNCGTSKKPFRPKSMDFVVYEGILKIGKKK
jgi:hypothetical protein